MKSNGYTVAQIDALPALIGAADAAAIAGVTVRAMTNAAARGRYKAVKVGKYWRFNKADLLDKLGLGVA